jgi:hypothetical protein
MRYSDILPESQSHWLLYRREWVTVRIMSRKLPDPYPLVLEAQSWARSHLAPRYPNGDIQLQLNTDSPMLDNWTGRLVLFWVCVQVFMESLQAEFPFASNAHVYAEQHGFEEYTVVLRDSMQDKEIRSGIYEDDATP